MLIVFYVVTMWLKCVKTIDCEKLAGLSVVTQYKQRAHEGYQLSVTVMDLGQCAGQTTGACFWTQFGSWVGGVRRQCVNHAQSVALALSRRCVLSVYLQKHMVVSMR